jgi:hypothetical protein
MTYIVQTWADDPIGATPITAVKLNHMEAGIAEASLTNGKILFGDGSPEAAVTAPVGTLFLRTDGGVGTTLYVKEVGVGNTGWAAK